ncbi:unnamed protein product [Prunus armeniaca]
MSKASLTPTPTFAQSVDSPTNVNPPLPPLNNLKRKDAARSNVWEHFDKLKKEEGTNDDEPRCICKYCKQDYGFDSRNGTSSLWTSPLRDVKSQKILSFVKEDKGSIVSWSFSKERSRLACARMIIRDELPFSHIENVGFRDFMQEVQPKFDPSSRRTIARDMWNLFQLEKGKFKSVLSHPSHKVSITTDTWTSLQKINYMVVTAHFIDVDWHLHKRIISFCVIPNHKGETIRKLLDYCLNDWGIDKVFTITVDNATLNDKMISYMKGIKELDNSIMAITNSVRYIHSSPARLESWRRCVAFEKLDIKGLVPLDVCTRWNSTYLLLEGALKYQRAFERMLEDDGDPHFVGYFMDDDVENKKKRVGPPTSNDWDCARVLIKFLKLYYEATLKFSRSMVVTSHQAFHQMCAIFVQLQKFCRSEDSLIKSVATSMKV